MIVLLRTMVYNECQHSFLIFNNAYRLYSAPPLASPEGEGDHAVVEGVCLRG